MGSESLPLHHSRFLPEHSLRDLARAADLVKRLAGRTVKPPALLDTPTEQEILATLHAVAEGRTSLTIAHRLSTIADADTILVLDEGQLAEHGSHAALLRKGGLYAEMWARQAEAMEDATEAAE